MIAKRLAGGTVAYYWNLPTWARDTGEKCPIVSAELGSDYGSAISKAKSYNVLLDAWRTRNEPSAGSQTNSGGIGTIDWLIAKYQGSDEYKRNIDASTRRNYDAGLALIADHLRKSRLRFGATMVAEILPHHADRLFEKIRDGGKSGNRVTTASHAIRAMRRAWNVVHRDYPKLVPESNPFRRVEGIGSSGAETQYANLEQLEAFVAKANELGHPSVAPLGPGG